MNQQILSTEHNFKMLDEYLLSKSVHKVFLVKSKYFDMFRICNYFSNLKNRLNIDIISFDHFHPNPEYHSVIEGEKLFQNEKCDCIIAIGGGSCIDVAKCIKLYYGLGYNNNLIKQTPIENDIPLIVLPTTAGTGSEATRYAVIYHKGEKQSITNKTIIPSAVIFDASVLEFLPDYQRKSTMLDAFAHAIESFWSVNSTEESKQYSRNAIQLILANYEAYLNNDADGNWNMLMAANIAGKAINITQTTAGHAMCYKLTSLYGISHGHAAALCVSVLWPYMINHTNLCIDNRGQKYLDTVFTELAFAMNANSAYEGAEKFIEILKNLELQRHIISVLDYEILKKSVNPIRLNNNPIALDEGTIDYLYHQIMEK